MGTLGKVLIVLLLAGAVAGTVALRSGGNEEAVKAPDAVAQTPATDAAQTADTAVAQAAATTEKATPAKKQLPRLVDLGAKSCIPCKMMAPILDELMVEYKDTFETVFIDVWENRSAGGEYGIRVIPTQIFYDADGKERFRHEGFYSKEDILAKWKELGVLS
jgi:thioredoxin 1